MTVTINEHSVVIVGAGPTGMMLGAELALAGVDVVILERRESPDLAGSRARGLHARTIEVFDQRGIAERFLSAGRTAQVAAFAGVPLDISTFPTRHPYGLALEQPHIERILLGWVDELGVPILRGQAVTGFTQDDTGVDGALSDGRTFRARYVVGCDGGRSVVRKIAGIDFVGSDPTVSHLLAEVQFREEPAEWGLRNDARGLHALSKMEGGKVGVMVTEREVGNTDEPTLGELSAALTAFYDTDFGVHSPSWLTRFTDMTRQAAQYRKGRVLLAGDAAHIHYPAGGQGLGIGIQDAANLGWKLAQVVKGTSPADLLDTYHAERHPIGARVLRDTMAAVALGRQDDRSKALHQIVTELVGMEEPKRRLAGTMSGLDVHYDLGEGHPLLGRRMPDFELVSDGGPLRVYTLLHRARPVLINLGQPESIDITTWADRLQRIDASYDGVWELPVIGAVLAPSAILIRPDGYVAWVGMGDDAGLAHALTRWFGEGLSA
jgi:3-(3-hydroxy-phenyl)propionate hydroxylase